jgi:hypothetical protein
MTLVVSDNDVRGAVRVIERIVVSSWAPFIRSLDLRFATFEEIGLDRRANDREVWDACQHAGAVLITGNRAADKGGLELVIRNFADATSLPVITLANSTRIFWDRAYAEATVVQLIDFLERIDSLRGTGRLYVP